MWAAPPPSQRKIHASALLFGGFSAAGSTAAATVAAPVFNKSRRVIVGVSLQTAPFSNRSITVAAQLRNHHEFGRIHHRPQRVFKTLAEFPGKAGWGGNAP